ncbi:putative phage-related tail protein [Cupriavidus necator]|uniref:Putative phage-related tail protein n=2 Tax=Cupriavidus necator TaxID=106590 RepID=A0A1K0IRJ0_CUPNE|nr:putative phage-related tail protein [Cupriavidus necator]
MIDAYKIGATLVLHDLIAPALLKLAVEFKKVDALAVNINKHLSAMGGHAAGIRSVSRASGTLANNMGKANLEAAQLARSVNAVHAASLAASRSAAMGHLGGGMGGGGGPTRPALPGPGGFISGTPRRRSGGAAAGGGGFGGGHGGNVHVGPGGFGVGAVGMAIPGGALAPVAGGFAALYATKAMYDAAKEYQLAETRFKTLNLGDAVNKDADKFARGTKVFGASSTALMETLRESVGLFGSLDLAKEVAPTLATLNAANSTLFGGKVGSLDEGAVRAVMRFNDMRGLTNNKDDFLRGLDLAQRMVTGSGGSLKFTDLEAMAKTGGAAFKGLSDQGIMNLATLAQEQGGGRTGTALMSLYQNLIAGRTPKKTMAALANAGLAELTEVTSGSVGGKQIKSTALKNIVDEKMLREDPAGWLMKYGTAAANRAGAKTDSEVIAFMNNLVSNRQGSNMAANFTTQQAQALRDAKMVANAKGVQGTIKEFQKTAPGAEADFLAAWQSVKAESASVLLPTATKILNAGADFFRSVIDFGQRNAGLIERLKTDGGMPTSPFANFGFGSGGPAVWLYKSAKAYFGSGGDDGGRMANANPVSGTQGGPVQVNSTVKLDSRVIAEVVTLHQSRELSRPQVGQSTFDPGMSMRPPALR